ncbi:hypothetical protein PTSG_03548 [Salpingoeca rosetta]|uniref:tRNA (uracil-O(2)-)-methyltransferase n=1 Tax=Salpingoeca rosetta (strain ATCC 50818 / BSB-021) TaxID=946362 RepID=F2U5X5_SALR5|nr:uncharacterized protein PTSG_03548 [Salpingoeca rosetta]EGD82916.1 hypothetical protein PTSG_03548 [Salpingoeca rosetta]|eukprot:XP_004995280.1 hypothetical protein PTSG_03548 [Salpingoeca rosetta]
MWQPVTSLSCGPKEGFARACGVFTEQLHVVNRRLIACERTASHAGLSVADALHTLLNHWRSARITGADDGSEDAGHHRGSEEEADEGAAHAPKRAHLASSADRADGALAGVEPHLPRDILASAAATSSSSGPLVHITVRRLISRMPQAFPHALDAVVTTDDGCTITVIPITAFSSYTPCYRLSWRGDDDQTADSSGAATMTLSCWVDPNTGLPVDPFAQPTPTADASDSSTNASDTTSKGEDTADMAASWPTVRWLRDRLLPKVVEWSISSGEGPLAKWRASEDTRPFTLTQYADKYQDLKAKYAETLVKEWPESTDPQKFVFEELGIAAYLCLLFEHTPSPQSSSLSSSSSSSSPPSSSSSSPSSSLFPLKFADLGCGNGLLTYVLNQEGYKGIGIDLRRRRIWDWYRPKPELIEAPVNPQLGCTFPQCEWLIGNHSDELTPWLPIMATLASPHQRMWVLPCCPFELNAIKHTAAPGTASQYDSYLAYVRGLVETLGFDVTTDVLRIPSTKRVCLIGSRAADIDDSTHYRHRNAAVDLLMDHRQFTPRPKKQVTRNCTKLPRPFLHECVLLVVQRLIGSGNGGDIRGGDDGAGGRECLDGTWRRGGELHLKDVASLLGRERLKRLKSECGGVKTLLKNHHQVFIVVGGTVRIRDWTAPDEKPPRVCKTRMCWFFEHHPDGCPRPAEKCPFKHGDTDTKDNYTATHATTAATAQ